MCNWLKTVPWPTVVLLVAVIAGIVVTTLFAPAERLSMMLSGEGIVGAIVLAWMRGLKQ